MLRLEILNVQHIDKLSLELDIDSPRILCIVGKNGVGKTTLVRAFRNVASSDTFVRTAPPDIFTGASSISYEINGTTARFEYDRNLNSLNCKSSIPQTIRDFCWAELPMPFGERFNFFRSISDVDKDIRRQIVLGEYGVPAELIEFLNDIYSTSRFDRLVETRIRGKNYYSILLEDGKYLREDYLSSGEHFLINLYRTIRSKAHLIVVDEIDLSLDAAAQVHLLRKLREFCGKYRCSIVFTTHSLAMMRMLQPDELLYMERKAEGVVLTPTPYSYVKAILFGFTGWDKYILTEDRVLEGLVEAIIQRYCSKAFFRYKIIYVAGGSQVVDLLNRNRQEGFLSEARNVIAVLDGDQREKDYVNAGDVYCLPIESVEKALFNYYQEPDFPHKLEEGKGFNGPKDLFNSLQRDQVMSAGQIYTYLFDRNDAAFKDLGEQLDLFLSAK